MCGADGDRARGIAGIVDARGEADSRRAGSAGRDAPAGVARRGDHDDARLHESIDFRTQRTLAARKHFGVELVTEAQVHAMNTHHLRIAIDVVANVGERTDDVARASGALLIQNLETDEIA